MNAAIRSDAEKLANTHVVETPSPEAIGFARVAGK
jgi:hypothetical protein